MPVTAEKCEWTLIVQNTRGGIIHDFEIVCECVVKGYIFIHEIAPCHNSKSTRTFQECNGTRFENDKGICETCIP